MELVCVLIRFILAQSDRNDVVLSEEKSRALLVLLSDLKPRSIKKLIYCNLTAMNRVLRMLAIVKMNKFLY